MRRSRILAGVTAIALMLPATPAIASASLQFHGTQSSESTTWECGYPMHVAVVASDTVVVRTLSGGAALMSDRFQVEETWTAADGRFFRIERNGVSKDIRATLVSGTVYAYTSQYAGQTATVIDPSGRVVYRDRGTISYSFLLDISNGAFTFLGLDRVAGKVPSFSVEMCKAVAPLVGTNSADYLTPRPIGSTPFSMGYEEYLPPSYVATGSAKSPLLIALNGYGETGDGNPATLSLLLTAGIPRLINIGGWPTDRPLVVLALQHVEAAPGFDTSSCDGTPWPGSCIMELQDQLGNASPAFCTTPDEVHAFIDYALQHYNVDPARVYVTGLSCGGYGAWEYLAKYGNDQVAAAIPIAGEGRPAWASAGCGLKSVAIWGFHGELDDTVNPAGTIDPMTSLSSCDGVSANRAKLTVYPGLYHAAWDQAYTGSLGDDIYSWMLSFTKS